MTVHKMLIIFGLLLTCPSKANAQTCPLPIRTPQWERIDPSFGTSAIVAKSATGETTADSIFRNTFNHAAELMEHFVPDLWNGTVNGFSINGSQQSPVLSFEFHRQSGPINFTGVVQAHVSHCEISYRPRDIRANRLFDSVCTGQRLWLDLRGSTGDLANLVDALVIDFCATPTPQGTLQIRTITTLLRGPGYSARRFFVEPGPYASRMMQAQSPRIMEAFLREYRQLRSLSR